MKYRDQIDSKLRAIARKVPYHKAIIRLANIYQVISFQFTRIPAGVSHRAITVEGYQGLKFKTYIFEPSDVSEKLPCLIYAHGGGFSYKAVVHHKKLACMYAMQANCRVFFPDYHLLPKYPYLAAYQDVLALYKCVIEHSDECIIDAERIGVAGDSAGGTIAALICNNYEREKLKPPCAQMLVYPGKEGVLWRLFYLANLRLSAQQGKNKYIISSGSNLV